MLPSRSMLVGMATVMALFLGAIIGVGQRSLTWGVGVFAAAAVGLFVIFVVVLLVSGAAVSGYSWVQSRRALQAGTGDWLDLTYYLDWTLLRSRTFAEEAQRVRLRVDRAVRPPDLAFGGPPAEGRDPAPMFRWLRAGLSPTFLVTCLDAGVNDSMLDAHTDGSTPLDQQTMFVMAALRTGTP